MEGVEPTVDRDGPLRIFIWPSSDGETLKTVCKDSSGNIYFEHQSQKSIFEPYYRRTIRHPFYRTGSVIGRHHDDYEYRYLYLTHAESKRVLKENKLHYCGYGDVRGERPDGRASDQPTLEDMRKKIRLQGYVANVMVALGVSAPVAIYLLSRHRSDKKVKQSLEDIETLQGMLRTVRRESVPETPRVPRGLFDPMKAARGTRRRRREERVKKRRGEARPFPRF